MTRKRLLKAAFAVAVAAILGLVSLLILLWVEHNTHLTATSWIRPSAKSSPTFELFMADCPSAAG
jgi:hypothetical protein